ncbi:hypothetical protein H6G76_28255 [Nostoc sp. FACHB-152]|uniref:hypothetical protein n=1 Tax=unclassified Nostoc TaxID=2593658 RepID=UPI001689FACA|nr:MULTISPECIES: hypothetical protein [unclassified Nostoc]MBD2450953.1 hypothetical protein [Nostoc sp. FACHB-152]MBD2469998.1 hypothetical protein [Nostoc sp. FACHB-145]
MKFKKSIQTLLLGIVLLFCLFLSIQKNLMVSEISTSLDSMAETDILSDQKGFPKLESAIDQYLMSIPSGYYTIAKVEELKSLMANRQ